MSDGFARHPLSPTWIPVLGWETGVCLEQPAPEGCGQGPPPVGRGGDPIHRSFLPAQDPSGNSQGPHHSGEPSSRGGWGEPGADALVRQTLIDQR